MDRKLTRVNAVRKICQRQYGTSKSSLSFGLDMVRVRFDLAKNLYRKDLHSHFGCVNAIEFSNDGMYLASGGDDRRVLLWNVEKSISNVEQPAMMKSEHTSNIFCLGFDVKNNRLFSAGNDEQVIIHDTRTGEAVDAISHDEAIYGLSVDPHDSNELATACDDGRVFIWDLRQATTRDPSVLIRSSSPFHAVVHNPVEPRLIATANSKEGVSLWDIRKAKQALVQYTGFPGIVSPQSAMSVRFNSRGTQVLALRRRLPPILYNTISQYPVAEFEHDGYYNSCTMKSCCFAGDSDQYVLSGSDDFKLYIWKIPKEANDKELSQPSSSIWVDKAHCILRGHRSIVNQVRYNYTNSIIASSGVEKVIKLWSVFPLPYGFGGIDTKNSVVKENRKVYSHEDYINLVLESGAFMTHDYSHQSVEEDPRMMAFFDSLVQRDIEGWTTDSNDESLDGNSGNKLFDYCYSVSGRQSSVSSSSENSDVDESIRVLNSYAVSYLSLLHNRIGEDATRSHDQPSTSSDSLINVISPQDINSDVNKISQMINEKKRDQLKKLARIAIKSTRRKLMKARKLCKTSSATSDSNYRQSRNQNSIEEVESLLHKLNERVCDNTDVEMSGHNNSLNNRNSRRNMRLKYLTDQSDFILNEVLPGRDSDSDSDSSNIVSGDELFEVLTSEFQRVRNLLPVNDADADEISSSDSIHCTSDSSSSSGSPLIKQFIHTIEIEKCDNTEGNEVNEKRNEDSLVRVTLNYDENDTVQLENAGVEDNVVPSAKQVDSGNSELNAKKDESEQGQRIQYPYLHNMCHPSTSSAPTASAECQSTTSSAVAFKTINQLNRSYRKRKLGANDSANCNDSKK